MKSLTDDKESLLGTDLVEQTVLHNYLFLQ